MFHELKNSEENGEEEENEVYIYRLPDELLLSIFTKLCDAKSLNICNVVSKRFSSIIPQTQSISLIIPQHNPIPLINPQNENFPKRIFSFVINNVLLKPFQYLQSKPPILRFDGDLFRSTIQSLKKFQNIRNLKIELPYFQRYDSLLKWHAEFGKDLNICFILFASSIREINMKQKPDQFNEDELELESFPLTNQLLQSRINAANHCFKEATWRRHILRHVVEDLDVGTLETVEITDSKRIGKLLMREKQLVELVDPRVKLPSSGYGKLWHVQVMNLPLCGYLLQGVTVVAIRCTYDEHEEGDENIGVRCLMEECFEGEGEEEELLREVLVHICDNNLPSTSLDINVQR